MTDKNETLSPALPTQAAGQDGAATPEAGDDKRKFVEPEVSFPVDVLEATSFFQNPESSVTN